MVYKQYWKKLVKLKVIKNKKQIIIFIKVITLMICSELTVDGSKEEKLLQVIDLKTNDGKTTCSKDTGGKKIMNCWSRGHFFVVSPCGQIVRWAPLYGYILDVELSSFP